MVKKNVADFTDKTGVSVGIKTDDGQFGWTPTVDATANENDIPRYNSDGRTRGVPTATAAEAADTTNDENPLVPSSLASTLTTITPSSGNITIDGSTFSWLNVGNVAISGNVVFHTIQNLVVGKEYRVRLVATGGPWAVTVDASGALTVNFGAGISIPSGKAAWFSIIHDGTAPTVMFAGYRD
jgi:hypothetical protein